MPRLLILSALTVTALAVFTPAGFGGVAIAGGGGHGTDACRGFSEGDRMVMRDNCFDGKGHVVQAGTTLTVVNEGDLPHTITAVGGAFDSGTLAPGEVHELAFDEPGHVPIYCTLHASVEGHGMAGLLVVSDSPDRGSDLTAGSGSTLSTTRWGWWVVALVLTAAVLVRRGRSMPWPRRRRAGAARRAARPRHSGWRRSADRS